MEKKQLSGIKYYFRGGSLPDKKVFVLHGYGANGLDLSPLADTLDPESLWQWYFLEAPIEMASIMGFESYAWFPIPQSLLQPSTRSEFKLAEIVPEGLPEASDLVARFIESTLSDGDSYLFGGFSQGSMVSLDCVLKYKLNPNGVFLLSSSMVSSSNWIDALKEHSPLNYFQSHGSYDPVLPILLAETLNQALIMEKWNGSFITFPGAHEIPVDVILELKSFFEKNI